MSDIQNFVDNWQPPVWPLVLILIFIIAMIIAAFTS